MMLAEKHNEMIGKSHLVHDTDEAYLPYAYPCDNYFMNIMSSSIIRNTLNAISKDFCSESIDILQAQGRFVDETSFPRLTSITKYCCKVLSVHKCPSVLVSPKLKGINALSVLNDDKPMVMVSRKAVVSLSDNELRFMLGHELGHIAQGNLVCHTLKGLLDNLNDKSEILGSIVADLVDVPLNEWYRCSEYTADRAGFLCSKSIPDIISLFNNISEANLRTSYYSYIELFRLHPFVNSRIEKIKEFAKEFDWKL